MLYRGVLSFADNMPQMLSETCVRHASDDVIPTADIIQRLLKSYKRTDGWLDGYLIRPILRAPAVLIHHIVVVSSYQLPVF